MGIVVRILSWSLVVVKGLKGRAKPGCIAGVVAFFSISYTTEKERLLCV